jgi:hypothetical protein
MEYTPSEPVDLLSDDEEQNLALAASLEVEEERCDQTPSLEQNHHMTIFTRHLYGLVNGEPPDPMPASLTGTPILNEDVRKRAQLAEAFKFRDAGAKFDDACVLMEQIIKQNKVDLVLDTFCHKHLLTQTNSNETLWRQSMKETIFAMGIEKKLKDSLTTFLSLNPAKYDVDSRRKELFGSLIQHVEPSTGRLLVDRVLYGYQGNQSPIASETQRSRAFYCFYLVYSMNFDRNLAPAAVELYQQLTFESILMDVGLTRKFAEFKLFAVVIDAPHKLKRAYIGIIK